MRRNIILSLLTICAATLTTAAKQTDKLPGAWHTQQGDIEHTAVFVDGYLSLSVYDVKNKKFISTRGGTYNTAGGNITVTWQFDTEKAASNVPIESWVGKTSTFKYRLNDKLTTDFTGKQTTWQRIDANDGPLAGAWRITGRKQGGEMGQIPLGDRRTLKILSGKRFQWIAINIKTGEFSGTGGGSYTFENGKYTENIEFFSRDNNRVGASLSFDGKVEDGSWHHAGLSSTGDPIYEIWDKLEK